jgi:hypothetical protein
VDFWDSLIAMKDTEYHHKSITRGDFNVNIKQSEKMASSVVQDVFREGMEDLIYEWELVDIRPSEGRYN